MENYIKPEMEVVELAKDNAILTSSCIIVSSTVTWQDSNGNWYSTTVPGN